MQPLTRFTLLQHGAIRHHWILGATQVRQVNTLGFSPLCDLYNADVLVLTCIGSVILLHILYIKGTECKFIWIV